MAGFLREGELTVTQGDDQFALLLKETLAPILEASSRTYLPEVVGKAYSYAVLRAAKDKHLAATIPTLIPDERTVAELACMAPEALAELCWDAIEVDPEENLSWLLDAEEIEWWDGPPEGGMNSGTAVALIAFDCNGLRYLYEWDFDAAGSQYTCEQGFRIETEQGRAAFEAAVDAWRERFDVDE